MRRPFDSTNGLALLAFALALLPPIAEAAPPDKASAKPRPVLSVRAQRRAARAAKEAAWIKNADPQKMVNIGKRPAFFNPDNLGQPPTLSAPSAILMDADTGQVLWTKNADTRRYPASTTKILTGLLLAEHSQPEDIVTCLDPNITKIEPSSLHIRPWEKFTAEDLLRGFLLRSGNDGAVVIAEHVSGTVPKFATLMNARARELGATGSNFVNPNGLPNKDHYSTARDLAMIARGALQNPRFADAVGTPARQISRSIVAQDSYIVAKAKRKFYDKFPGADGVKTGYTRAAGHCFVGSATRDGRRLLSVVLGARNSAIGDTIPVLSWGFKRFPRVTVVRKGLPTTSVPVSSGTMETVSTVAGGDLRAATDASKPGGGLVVEVRPRAGLQAPVSRGQEVGVLVANVGGKVVGQVPLLASADLPRSALGTVLTGGGVIGSKSGLPGRLLALLCGALLLLLVGFRYGSAVFRTAAGSAAPAKNNRRRRDRVAPPSRGDYRLR
ncbi:MAG: D-alanyl-D-alanine carboxypeptidase [Cytophagales bacterium]|nr:D-alanyl-D-alanine carboxypeptidase [Armatimonadota bacterium]